MMKFSVKPRRRRAARVASVPLGLFCVLGLLAAVLGCGREADEVRVYTARIDPPAPPIRADAVMSASMPPTSTSAANAGTPMPREVSWALPADAGWRETGEANQFRLTTLRAGESDDPGTALEVAVSRVPGPAGTISGNVNRWRQQLGLPPLEQEQVVPLVDYANNEALPGFFTRMDSADGRAATMIAWFQFESPEASWFFKANGTPAALDTHREAFDALVASVRRTADTQPDPHAGHTHAPGEPHPQ